MKLPIDLRRRPDTPELGMIMRDTGGVVTFHPPANTLGLCGGCDHCVKLVGDRLQKPDDLTHTWDCKEHDVRLPLMATAVGGVHAGIYAPPTYLVVGGIRNIKPGTRIENIYELFYPFNGCYRRTKT